MIAITTCEVQFSSPDHTVVDTHNLLISVRIVRQRPTKPLQAGCVVQYPPDGAGIQRRYRRSDGFIQQRSDVLLLIPVSCTKDHYTILEKDMQNDEKNSRHVCPHSVKTEGKFLVFRVRLSVYLKRSTM